MSQWVTDKHSQWSDSGPIKRYWMIDWVVKTNNTCVRCAISRVLSGENHYSKPLPLFPLVQVLVLFRHIYADFVGLQSSSLVFSLQWRHSWSMSVWVKSAFIQRDWMNDFSTEGAQVVLGLFIQWSTLSLVESSYVKSSLVIYHLSYHLTIRMHYMYWMSFI